MSMKKKIRAKWATDLVEPVLSEDYTQFELMSALSWYAAMVDTKTKEKYLSDYLKSRGLDKVVDEKVSYLTSSVVARLIDRGQVTDTKTIKWMNEWVDQLKDKEPIKNPIKRITIQERMRIKGDSYIDGLDDGFEEFLESGMTQKFDMKSYLKTSEIKPSYKKYLIKWIDEKHSEFLLSKTDPEMKEGYSNYTTRQKNKIIKFFEHMHKSVDVYYSK